MTGTIDRNVLSNMHIGCLVANQVLGKSAKPFWKYVERMVQNNGPEFAVKRIKAIRTAALHLRNGDPGKAKEIYQALGIAYHKADGLPKGPFRNVVRQFVEAQRPSVIRRFDSVLRIYTSIRLTKPTRGQIEKSKKSISGECKSNLKHTELYSLGYKWMSDIYPDSKESLRGTWRAADLFSVRSTTYKYSRRTLGKSDRNVPLRQTVLSAMTEPWVPPSLPQPNDMIIQPGYEDEGINGKIAMLQEQGAKARVVAMPSTRLQLAFQPMKEVLTKFDRENNSQSSCVEDQLRAVYGALLHMEFGADLFCTDLSSATDRFPRWFSEAILDYLGLPEFSSALEQTCRRDWLSRDMGRIRYETGQPMGLEGSFILFHLSNQLVARYAEKCVVDRYEARGLTPPPRFWSGLSFYVLGDDIIHSSKEYAREYRDILTQFGCDISPDKTFDGSLGEFAGFILTRAKGGEPFAYRPYKVPDGKTITNPIDFLANLGVRAKALSPKWEERLNDFLSTIGDRNLDLSPLVSDETEDGKFPLESSQILENELLTLKLKYGDWWTESKSLLDGVVNIYTIIGNHVNVTPTTSLHSPQILRATGALVDIPSYNCSQGTTITPKPMDRLVKIVPVSGEKTAIAPQEATGVTISASRRDLKALDARKVHPRRLVESRVESDPLMRKARNLRQSRVLKETEKLSSPTLGLPTEGGDTTAALLELHRGSPCSQGADKDAQQPNGSLSREINGFDRSNLEQKAHISASQNTPVKEKSKPRNVARDIIRKPSSGATYSGPSL